MPYKEIQYPQFLDAMKYADDVWMAFFEDMAYGNFPFGVYVKDQAVLYCNIKNKSFMFQFYDKDGQEIYTSLREIFFSKFHIHREENTIDMRIQHIEWSKIKKKSIKNILIEQFVIDKKKEFELSFNQVIKLLSNISLGLYFKLLSKNDICYDSDNCVITEIQGIDFKPKQIYFTNVFSQIPEKLSISTSYDNDVLHHRWVKFLS